jgi:hypothetical protein
MSGAFLLEKYMDELTHLITKSYNGLIDILSELYEKVDNIEKRLEGKEKKSKFPPKYSSEEISWILYHENELQDPVNPELVKEFNATFNRDRTANGLLIKLKKLKESPVSEVE